MQPLQREARKHPRYAVEGLCAVVNGVDVAIIDISVKAVRVVGRLRDLKIVPREDAPISLIFKDERTGETAMNGGGQVTLNRHCDVFTVLMFEVSDDEINELISKYDSFSNTELKELF